MKVRKQAEHKHWIASAHVVLSTNARNLVSLTSTLWVWPRKLMRDTAG